MEGPVCTGKRAVIVTFSYDPEVSVLVFDTWNEAWSFIKEDVRREHIIDIEENGFDSEYVIDDDEERAVLTTHGSFATYTTEWRIGTVFKLI